MTTHDPRHARSVTTPSPGVGTFGDAVVDGVDVDAEVSRMGDPVPPIFWLRDPEGNTLMVVEV